MARVPAIELAPGVVRIPTIGAAATNSFALVDDDGSVQPPPALHGLPAQRANGARPRRARARVAFTHGTEITDGAREAVRGFLTEVAGA